MKSINFTPFLTWETVSENIKNFQVYRHNYHANFKDKKEEIWLSPMTKAPTPTEMSKGQSHNTNNATKSSIKQRLRTYFKDGQLE